VVHFFLGCVVRGLLRLTRAFIFIPVSVLAFFAPATSVIASSQYLSNGSFVLDQGGWSGPTGGASCSNGMPAVGGWDGQNGLFFSYVQGSVNQQIVVPEPSSLTLSYTVAGVWGGTYQATLADSDEVQSTGVSTASMPPQNQTLSITTTSPNELVTVTFSGKDGLFWAGCYGPSIKNASLIGEPTVPAIPENSVWQKVWENQSVLLTAPEGSTFTGISFISYGLPDGENGQYTINPGCHATLSEEQLSQYLGQATLEIGAFNHIFGDPCPGIGKRLAIVTQYSSSPTTTTTIAPYFNPVQNLTAVADTDGNVVLNWDAPTAGNTAPYMYNISFVDLVDEAETGGWGIWTYATNTSYSLGPWMWPGTTGYGPVRFKIQAGTAPCVGEGEGSCMYGPETTIDTVVIDPTPPTTTTTTTSTTTTTTTTTIPETTVPETTTTWVPTTTSTVPATTTTTTVPATTVPVTTLPPTTTTTSTTVPPTTTIPPTTNQPTTTAVPEPPLESGSSEAIIEEILDLEPEQLAELIEELDISSTSVEAIAAIFSEEVLSELSTEQVDALITEIASAELTDEQAEVLAAALSEAPAEVKEAFEEEINVFGGQFDTYVPANSVISVGERRVVVAAGAIIAAAPITVSSRRR